MSQSEPDEVREGRTLDGAAETMALLMEVKTGLPSQDVSAATMAEATAVTRLPGMVVAPGP